MSIVDINPEDAKKKLDLLRRYPSEIKDIILLFCIVYLFIQLGKVNERLNSYLMTDRVESVKIQVENNAIMRDNNEVLHDVKNILFVIKDLQDSKKNVINNTNTTGN